MLDNGRAPCAWVNCLYNLFFTTNQLLDMPLRNKSARFPSRLLESKNGFRRVSFRDILLRTVLLHVYFWVGNTSRSLSKLTWKMAINYTGRVSNVPNTGEPVVIGGLYKRVRVVIIKKKPFSKNKTNYIHLCRPRSKLKLTEMLEDTFS